MARDTRKPPYLSILLGLSLVALSLWAQQTEAPEVRELRDRLEQVAYDLRFRLIQPFARQGGEPVVIVAIDEPSVEAEGSWPWPRAKLAELVARLSKAGALVVGLDLAFPEPGPTPDLDGDRALAGALAEEEAVLGYRLAPSGPRLGELGPALPVTEREDFADTAIPRMDHHLGNVAPLQEAAASGGFVSVFPDEDGVLRRYQLLLGHGDALYPSLALEMARLYLMAEEVRVATAPAGEERRVDHLSMAGLRIPTGRAGEVPVPYRGPRGRFPYLSATEVLSGDVPPERVEGRMVLIGATPPGPAELQATPVQTAFPRVEVHASVLRGLLEGAFPRSPSWAEGASLTFMVLAGLLLALALPFLRFWSRWALTGALALLLVGGNLLLWAQWQWTVPVVLPLGLVMALGLLNAAPGPGFTLPRPIRLGKRHVPGGLSGRGRRPGRTGGGAAERRDLTVLSARFRGLTHLSETLHPKELQELVDELFSPMAREILAHHGTLDTDLGERIRAFWGAPLEDPHQAGNAVRTALAMREEARRLGFQLQRKGLPDLGIGIGLHSGLMLVGDLGSALRPAYRVLGEAVDLGERLEGLSGLYGASIVASDVTREGLEGEILFRRLDRIRVPGREEPLTIFEPLCPKKEASSLLLAEVERLEEALAAFWRREWAEAEERFSELLGASPEDPLYHLYLDRIQAIDPTEMPADWDGAYRTAPM
ncbi:MAG: CHASE2 domain-containing protein [Thiohalorhabdus sp.]|uniref:CHASE2 domain-containing protein n=1 Tax=Thiohalorhabdus sp. TaxID=3094134 RepID=UPI00398185D9